MKPTLSPCVIWKVILQRDSLKAWFRTSFIDLPPIGTPSLPSQILRDRPRGLPRSWGSGGDGGLRVAVVGGLEALPEAAAERAVVEGAADLEQPVGTTP